MAHSIQIVARHDVPITSPCFGPNGDLFAVSQNGDIYRYVGYYGANNMGGGSIPGQVSGGGPSGVTPSEAGGGGDNSGGDGSGNLGTGGGPSSGAFVESWGNSSGQPLGLLFDSQGVAFVCDCAHQSIFRISRMDGSGNNGSGGGGDGSGGGNGSSSNPTLSIEPYVREYESQSFLGPNGIVMGKTSGLLFFTDSGPLGETSIQNSKGSVFVINPTTQLLIPLAYRCLAYPSGLALSPDEKVLYVSETNMNRILRFTQSPVGVYHCSVFHQLSGRFGPTALCVSSNGDLFVAHFDFCDNSDNGRILIIDSEGEVSAVMSVPGPEITGLCLTPDEKFLLITEGSGNSLYRHPLR